MSAPGRFSYVIGQIGLCLAAILLMSSVRAEEFHPTRYTPDIKIIEVSRTRERTIEVCHDLGAKTRSDRYAGCAVTDLSLNICRIYFVETANNAREHERKHCVYGRYHDVD